MAMRSEEQKRGLRVDLKRIPEWESRVAEIRADLDKLNLSRIADFAQTVDNSYHVNAFDSREHRLSFDTWIDSLSVDSLIKFDGRFRSPHHLCAGVSIANDMERDLEIAQSELKEAKLRGVTISRWVSMFTNKTHSSDLETYQLRFDDAAYSVKHTVPNVLAASAFFEKLLETSKEYWRIHDRLQIAYEKRDAIQRFEKKHGNAFAKAARQDNKTRTRASSLKRLVQKTQYCPYCAQPLGSDPHLDHIYPVAAGGLSIEVNLVWCCVTCNSKKSDKGLLEFLTDVGLPVDTAISELRKMGKKI